MIYIFSTSSCLLIRQYKTLKQTTTKNVLVHYYNKESKVKLIPDLITPSMFSGFVFAVKLCKLTVPDLSFSLKGSPSTEPSPVAAAF